MRTLIIGGLLGAGLVTAALAFSPAQDFDDFGRGGFDDSAWDDFQAPTKAQEKRNADMDELLQGAWQLVEFETDSMETYGRRDRGVALFGHGFMSIEMHIAYEPTPEYPDVPGPVFFQSGTFRYRFDDVGNLLTKLIIGAGKSDPIPEIIFERPGSVRSFEIQVTENRLEMRREPGRFLYVFTRLRNAAREKVDIFGRPIPDDEGVDPLEDPEIDPLEGPDPLEDPKDREQETPRRRRGGMEDGAFTPAAREE